MYLLKAPYVLILPTHPPSSGVTRGCVTAETLVTVHKGDALTVQTYPSVMKYKCCNLFVTTKQFLQISLMMQKLLIQLQLIQINMLHVGYMSMYL